MEQAPLMVLGRPFHKAGPAELKEISPLRALDIFGLRRVTSLDNLVAGPGRYDL